MRLPDGRRKGAYRENTMSTRQRTRKFRSPFPRGKEKKKSGVQNQAEKERERGKKKKKKKRDDYIWDVIAKGKAM